MEKVNLTDLELEAMNRLASDKRGEADFFTWFDDGIVAGGGTWGDVLVQEILGKPHSVNTAKGVLGNLVKKGIFETSDNDGDLWFELTEKGEEILKSL